MATFASHGHIGLLQLSSAFPGKIKHKHVSTERAFYEDLKTKLAIWKT